jgi:hypothetical protein
MSFDSLFDGSDAHMLSILDTVEPTGWYRDNCGDIGSLVLYADRWDGIANDKDFIAFYSRKTVESLLASLTKEHEQRMAELQQILTKISSFNLPDPTVDLLDESPEMAVRLHNAEVGDTARAGLEILRRMAEGTRDD